LLFLISIVKSNVPVCEFKMFSYFHKVSLIIVVLNFGFFFLKIRNSKARSRELVVRVKDSSSRDHGFESRHIGTGWM